MSKMTADECKNLNPKLWKACELQAVKMFENITNMQRPKEHIKKITKKQLRNIIYDMI